MKHPRGHVYVSKASVISLNLGVWASTVICPIKVHLIKNDRDIRDQCDLFSAAVLIFSAAVSSNFQIG